MRLRRRQISGCGRARPTLASVNPSRSGTMSNPAFDPDNVIVVGFAEDDRAYEALTTLKELASQGQIGLGEAAVLVRDEDGHIDVKDQIADPGVAGTPPGGPLGPLIGLLGRPPRVPPRGG